jgi:hypothetical protein
MTMSRLMLLFAIAGCAHTPAATPPPPVAAAAPSPSPSPSPAPLTVRQRLQSMTESLEREDFAGALRGTDEWLAAEPDTETRALIYNCRTWIRWGAGDKAAAFAENEMLPKVVAQAPPEEHDVQRSVLLHYWWDRSYLFAEAGKRKEAEAARAEFDKLGNRPDNKDSRKVLDAWLRLSFGDGKGARKSALEVDLEKDGDLQDLYVVERAFDAGGDAARAAQVRKQIEDGSRYPMKPLILQQMKRDAVPRR